jgi:hypothetical protein
LVILSAASFCFRFKLSISKSMSDNNIGSCGKLVLSITLNLVNTSWN